MITSLPQRLIPRYHNKVLSTFDRGYDSGIDRHKYRDALNADALTAFVSSGGNVDARNETGKTALMLTSSADVMQALIKAGADVNARDVEGRVPLMFLGDHNCFADSFASVVPQIGCDRLYQEDEDDVLVSFFINNHGMLQRNTIHMMFQNTLLHVIFRMGSAC